MVSINSPNSFAVGVLAVLRATRAAARRFAKKQCFSDVFCFAGCISRGIRGTAWRGGVFLEKKTGLDGLGAYFSRKRLVWMALKRIS